MLVDHMEPADVAILDAALSGESRGLEFECLDATPPAATGFGSPRRRDRSAFGCRPDGRPS